MENTKFLLEADQQIETQLNLISSTLEEHVNEKRNGEGFDPLITIASFSISGARVIQTLVKELNHDESVFSENVQKLSYYIAEAIQNYEPEANILEICQALLSLSSSFALSFAEEYYEQKETLEETKETTEQV
ncbi:MAG: hypothetical protein N2043_01560 [Ignavibacterium sp.]|nr:hypothetical protein [Ignavibacterium sp.]